jgi:hypothetical protein
MVRTDTDVLLRLEALARLLEGLSPQARKALVTSAVIDYLASTGWESSTG